MLDFPANTPSTRAWMRGLFEEAAVPHRLHYLDTPDALCRARLHARNAGGHPIVVGDGKFDVITSYFVPPAAEEGFNVVVHQPE